MKTLVVGATGALGFEICRRLIAAGVPVRALVRPGALRESDLHELGAEIVYGDLTDPPSLEAACRGVARLMSTASAMKSRQVGDGLRSVDHDGHRSLLKAATACNVDHVVYTSVSSEASPRAPLVKIKRRIERAVRESGMTWTILQPAAFMETCFSAEAGWDIDSGRVRIVGPGTARFNPVSLHDVAEFTLPAITRPDLERRVLSIGGPDIITAVDAVRVFEDVAGKKLQVTHVSAGVISAAATIFRPFNPSLSSALSLAAGAAKGEVIDMALLLSECPVAMTTLRAFAERRFGERVS